MGCLIKGGRIKWFTDNQNVVRIIKVGSRVEELQVLALNIFKSVVLHGISIEPEWVPREGNQLADTLSRIVDYDDWGITKVVFQWLDSLWGPHSINRFANSHNRQTERYNSRFYDVGTEAMDTFTVNWAGECNWWCPPIHLVCRMLEHARTCCSRGTLIVPAWRSAPFWPVICPGRQNFAVFVQGSAAR